MKVIKVISKFLLFILILVFLSGAGLFLMRNKVAEVLIEKTGTKIVGAKVDVENVYISPFDLKLTWEKLEITDKRNTMKNIIETGNCVVDIDMITLLNKKLKINDITLSNVKYNTVRKNDGKVEERISDKNLKNLPLVKTIRNNLLEEKNNIPIFNPNMLKKTLDVNKLIAEADLQAPREIKNAKKEIDKKLEYWDARIKANDYKKDVDLIEKDVKYIESELNKIDEIGFENVENIVEMSKNVGNIYKNYEKTYAKVIKDKSELELDLRNIKSWENNIGKWMDDDYKKILKEAKTVDFDIENIGTMLLGEKVFSMLIKIMDTVEIIRSIENKDENISVANKKSEDKLPGIWIKNLTFDSVLSNGLNLNGTIKNLSSNQSKSKEIMKINLESIDEKLGIIKIKGEFNYITDDPEEMVKVDIEKMRIKNTKFGGMEFIPIELVSASCNINSSIKIQENLILSSMNIEVKNIKFKVDENKKVEKQIKLAANAIANEVKNINMKANIIQNKTGFDYTINSDLDKIISKEMNKIFSKETSEAKNLLKKKVESKINNYSQNLKNHVSSNEKELLKQVNNLYNSLNKEKDDLNFLNRDLEGKINFAAKRIEGISSGRRQKAEIELLSEMKKLEDEFNLRDTELRKIRKIEESKIREEVQLKEKEIIEETKKFMKKLEKKEGTERENKKTTEENRNNAAKKLFKSLNF